MVGSFCFVSVPGKLEADIGWRLPPRMELITKQKNIGRL